MTLHQPSATQRAMEAAKIDLISTRVAERLGIPPVTIASLAQDYDVPASSIQRSRFLREHGTAEMIKLIEDGLVTLGTAERVVAGLDATRQDRYVARVRAGFDPQSEAPPYRDGAYRRPVGQPHHDQAATLPASAVHGFLAALEGLGMVLARTQGLSTAITPDQAARWASDLARHSKYVSHLSKRLKEIQP